MSNIDSVTKYLGCKLEREEIEKYSRDLARATQDCEELESQKKNITADFGNKISAKKLEARTLSMKVSTGEEYRDVECRWNYDWANDHRELVRQDTFETVETDCIPECERQQHFKLTTAPKG